MHVKIPSKTFLLGEYGALCGGAAYILTHPPFFECRQQQSANGQQPANTRQPTDTPQADARRPPTPGHEHILPGGQVFIDPHQGRGGFGASSAKFICEHLCKTHKEASAATDSHPDINTSLQKPTRQTSKAVDLCPVLLQDLLAHYRRANFKGQGFMPSGYDCVAQYKALNIKKFAVLRIGPNQDSLAHTQQKHKPVQPSAMGPDKNELLQADFVPWKFKGEGQIILFRTGFKIPTHQHLEQLQPGAWQKNFLAQKQSFEHTWKQAFQSWAAMCRAVHEWAMFLEANQLIDSSAQQMLHSIRQHTGVQAAKGCGALGADVVCVLCPCDQAKFLTQSLSRLGLSPVAEH